MRLCVCVSGGGLFNALQVGSCSRSGQIRAAHGFLLGGRETGTLPLHSHQPLNCNNGATSAQTWIHSAPCGLRGFLWWDLHPTAEWGTQWFGINNPKDTTTIFVCSKAQKMLVDTSSVLHTGMQGFFLRRSLYDYIRVIFSKFLAAEVTSYELTEEIWYFSVRIMCILRSVEISNSIEII